MKNLITLAFMAGLATMAACSSDDSSTGTGGAAGAASGGGGTGGGSGGSGGSATGGSAGMGGSATGGSAGMGGAAGGTGQDCITCMTTNCATELGACQANADCAKIVTCAAACTDQACADKCITDNPNGKTAWDAVEACGTTKCATECQ